VVGGNPKGDGEGAAPRAWPAAAAAAVNTGGSATSAQVALVVDGL
jgi:hypothetical protein